MSEYIVSITDPNDTLAALDEIQTKVVQWDATSVVRCAACRFCTGVTDGWVCRRPCGDSSAGRAWVEPDGFCAWGRPRSK